MPHRKGVLMPLADLPKDRTVTHEVGERGRESRPAQRPLL